MTVSPKRGICSELLPKKVWVSAGEEEIFLENILEIVKYLKEEDVDVTLDVKKGGSHDLRGRWAESQRNWRKKLGEKVVLELLESHVRPGSAWGFTNIYFMYSNVR